MQRRDALAVMAGMSAMTLWGRSGAGAWQQSTEDVPLPELMKNVGPMMDHIPVVAQPLATGLKLVTGPGGNITALDGPDGLFLVDSFVPGHVAALIAAVGKPEAGKPITLIDTHWHFDHAGGNAELGAMGAKILAHTNARARLATPQVMTDFNMKLPASPRVALPVVTIDDKATIYANGETIQLTHVPPAHTDGDIFIHYQNANVLQTGDLFTNGSYCNIDSSSRGWVGGMIAAIDIILPLVDAQTKIVPGHGPLGTKADLQAFQAMLAEAQARVEPMVVAGKTVDEVIAARPLAKLDPIWAKGIFKGSHFATLVYNGLVKHRAEVAQGR